MRCDGLVDVTELDEPKQGIHTPGREGKGEIAAGQFGDIPPFRRLTFRVVDGVRAVHVKPSLVEVD